MSKGKEAGKIQVYVRVRPFTEREKEKREPNAIEIHQEHSLIRVLDPRSRTNYFFDGVFSPEASNQELYFKVGKPLVYAALNGYKGTLLTYGQTGTGKTFTLLSDDGITTRVVQHCFEKIDNDEIHTYKVMCSFLQVYQEKVYDLLNPRLIMDLPVREHPKKGVYVANLTQHEVKSAGDVFALLEIGKQHLVIAETKMVRQSSRSHSIMQLIIERRLKEHIANEKPPSQNETSASHEAVQESIMAVDETINNLIKELKQERKSHHKRERECLKELMEKELNKGNNFEGDLIVKGKINLCDLAGSERLTKTKAEGVRLTEAKYLNTSLLELGNVIHALARGHKRHVPYRNSTLTRLLQDCLGDNGKTNFIICIAPSLGEVNETKCSLNFGLRAMRITNVARLNVEVDYKVLAERLAKKIEDHDIKYKFEKLEYLREIQRLKSAISCYQESENFAGKDHEKLVSVIANLSKSVQREKEEKTSLQTELVCLKRQASQPIGSAADVEAVLLAELMSMELLANLQTPDATKSILSDSSLPAKVKSHLALADTQEALLNNASCFLQLLDLHLDSDQDGSGRKLAAPDAKDYVQFNFSRAGAVELFSKDCSIKISPRGAPQEPCLSLPMYNPASDEATTGLAGGVRRMLGKLIGRETKEKTSPDAQPKSRACADAQCSVPGSDIKASGHDQEEAMIKTKALLKQLTSSKEKVEQQVLNLMSSLFDEQIVRKEGQSPQWNELGKKLTRLIMFRRNNMPGLSDADMWANSEDLNSILENCLRFVIIDKALLACLLVIELLDLRQACGKLGDRRQFLSTPDKSAAQETTLPSNKPLDETLGEKGNMKSSASNGNKKVAFNGQDIWMNMPKGAISPRREKLRNLKHGKTELEKEISDTHEDTTKLETELFSSMEDKTKVEEELFGMKHHVTKLRSELFHLKLEKSNLESDVKRSKSQENLHQCTNSDEEKLAAESPKEALRGYPELSDVMEASHESNDSENSSQMSDGNETREAFLKTCMENISKIYTLMPNPDEEIASEDELSDDQEPTLSDANIDDSDEEIVITKLARSLRSPCTSTAKERTLEASSPTKSGKKEAVSNFSQKHKVNTGNDNSEDLKSKSKEALVKQIQELKRKLHKAEQELAIAQETSEDLEEELDHKKGQLAEAQGTITNLENQVVEEKETCEQVRQEYFNIKTQNEILDVKMKALRSELERVLVRENNALSSVFKPAEGSRKDNPPLSPTKTSTKSPLKSPGKAKVSKIDLRTPPPKRFTLNEMEMVSLIEENAELKVKLGKATQEKARLEKSQKLVEEKSTKMKVALQASEDACSRFKDELANLSKEKIKLTGEVTDLRNNSSKIAEELQKYREKSSRLEKDIEAIAYMSTRLEKDNKTLEMEISKMESELSSCKSKHEVSSQECERLNQERVQVEKECEKALHDLETLRKEKRQLLESEVSEQKRLNSNLQKELAGMAEYQEALENEYSKAKNAEDRLKQELAKVSHRVTEMETGLAVGTQNTLDEGAITNHREGNLSFDHVFNRNPYKPEVIKEKKSFTGTPIKKFYTITHTSEDEIGDTSSSIAESPADESKQVEHENQLLKLENGYLQQQLAESEHVLALYRQDLETAHDLIDKLQADVKVFAVDTKTAVAEDDCKTPSDKDDTIKEIGDYSDNANDEYKLLEEKHAELTREYEILRQQYQEALTDKENVTDGVTIEAPSLMEDVQTKYQTEKEVSSSNQDVSGLQERIRQLEADNVQLKITAEELSRNEKAKTALMKSLEDAKRVKISLEERINKLESENKALQLKHDVPAMQKDNKSVRRRSLNNQVTRLKDTNEALKAEVLQCTGGCHNHPLQLQHATKENEVEKTAGVSEMKMRKLEEDLLKVTSEKLTLEFELRSAYNDCERLKNDLHQSESERNLLNTQLNDNIERAANLEIRLMEMRCSCDTIKDEINTLKSQKRQERFHLHEASVCKEILEKRLEDALRENNFLHHELDTMREERKENEKNSARLEKEKDHLTKEIDDVKTEIRRLEQDFEESKVRTSQIGEKENSNKDTIKQEHCRLEKLTEYKILHEKDQEQLMVLREEVEKLTADHNQMKIELKDIIDVKENLEKQIENMKTAPVENGDPSDVKEDEEIINTQNENAPECERTTFDTLEIEKHTKLLEKEKGLLEKELTRVQEECNKLKEKLEIIRHASQNEQTQEKRRKELEGKQEQLEKDLQELRELNQKLEIECDDSHKLIQELEIKTKALESLQNELHCFHEENDRLTHEVEIIHNTSKAMTDHQRTKESLEAENTLLKQELESFNDRNKKLQMQTEDTSKELLTLKEQKKNISQSTEKKNISLKSEVEKFQKMQQHLETELATTREKVTEREIANESLKKENKAVKGRIKSLEQRNEELRRKDEKKKACTAENKSKAKSKHGQSVIKESNEAPTICHEGNEKDLREKVEQMEHEKAHLEEQLNILKKKVNTECAAVSKAPGVTIATQTTEFQPVDQAVKTLNNNAMTTAIENHDPKSNKESAPLTEEYKTGISLMAKEKLLLEKKATLFARAQMQLEQSFAKALKENAALKAKVGEADNVLEFLRDKVHELEKNNSTSLSVVDLKNNVLMSSDSESDSNDEDPSNDGTKEGQNEGRSASNNTNSEEVNKSAKSNEEGCLSNPTQSEVDQLRKEKEQLIKELKGLKSQKEHMESDVKQKEDLRISAEKDREVQQSVMNDDHSCLANSTQTEVDQPRSETEQLIEEQKSLKSQKEDMESVLEQQNKDLENPTETQREQESTYNNDSGCVLNPTKSEVDLLQSKQEHLLKAPAGLKSQNEDMESVLKQKKEDLNVPIETEREVQHSAMSDDHCCLSKPTKSEVDQLRREKEQLIKDLEVLKSQKVQLETDLKQKKENVGAPTETDTPFEKLKEENALLKRERKSLLEELEAGKNERNLTESELRHNKELCLKQEQEIKLLLSSYSQEKESLLKEVDNTRTDCRKAKEKLRELQQIESDFEDIRKKSNEAENLITELEKDLLSQTEMKNELRRELQTCKNELKKIEHLETQLRSSRIENEDLHTTNLQLTEQVKKWKDENESKNIRLQFQKIEKQKKNSLNANPSMKRFQNQCVQTESAIDHYDCVNELLEDNTASSSVKCDSDNTNHGDKNNVGGVKNNSEDVENNMDGVENDVEGHKHLPHASAMEIKFYEQNRTGGSEPGGLDATEMAQTDQTNKEIGETATYNTETSFSGVPIPIIIVSHVDDIKTSNSENTAILSLCIEDFESHSPNDQSTPDEEKEQFKPSVNNGNTREIQGEPLDDINKPSVQNDVMSLEVNLPQAIKDIQISNTKLGLQASTKPTQDTANNVYEFGQQHADDDPRDVLNNQALELDWRLETHFTNTDKDTSKSRRELEWTISSLASELEQRVEDHEKNQLEIGLLVEEQLSMKREIISLTSECASLRAKADTLRTQNEAVLKEQILNDEELEELQQNLKDLKQEKNLIDEAKKNLESQKARLEIELSDAIETREAMERELLRIRTENIDVSKHRLEAQLRDISERYTKLETVLSCILDENSKMTAELSALQAENNMLKSFKIMEITDNFTQFSPRTTEDESDGEGTRSTRREKSGITTLFTSKANLTLSLGNNLTNLPSTSSPSSSEHQRKLNSSVTPNQAQDDQGPNTPTASHSKGTELCAEPVENTFHQEGKSRKRDQVLFTGTNDHEVAKTRHKASSVGTPTLPTKFESKVTGSSFKDTAVMENKLSHRKQQKNTSKKSSTLNQKYDASEDATKRDSDDNDSSMEIHTSSSLVSVTDLDISISSDQISSEDSSIVGPEIRVLQKMQKELSETKCSNVLVKNELSIIRKHNSDLQNQVQKLLSRNNHLKMKMCDRTLSVKRMEKEVSSIKDENNRLQQQALVLQEEMTRVEKEKAKFERNMSSTKSENKRLKSDLSNIKAESYRTMKELVNLQSENRMLQLEIEKVKEEARSFKGDFSDESVSQELSLWGSISHGDFRSTSRRSLQERPAKPDPVYLQQRASSELAFSQHQRLPEHPETPELSPLNLSKELNEQHGDGGNYGKGLTSSADTISVNSTGGSRLADPVSRRGSPLSFTSEAGLPSEPNDRDENEHNGEKVEEQEQDEEEGKGKSRKKIKTILRKLQHSKKSKSSK